MMNILNFYEAGKARSGTALFPFADASIGRVTFSTRSGNAVIDWGDGTKQNVTTDKMADATLVTPTSWFHNYSPNYTGNVSVKINSGLQDVYSLLIGYIFGTVISNINIQDFTAFINQFKNLYSLNFNIYTYQNPVGKIIKGDLATVPDSVERINIVFLEIVNAPIGDFYFNFSSLKNTSKLKFFNLGDGGGSAATNLRFLGDIAKLPTGCIYFKAAKATSNSAITYTAGKVWASSFDTLSIPVPLSHTELDNLLVDMNNSITTKIGAGVIALGGYRSATSDAAVASLIAKGFTVNVMRLTRTLNLPLSANLLDTSGYANNAVMVGTESHSNSGLITGTGKYAYSPSSATLQMGASSIGFGCEVKFNSTPNPALAKGIVGKSITSGTDGRYAIYVINGNIGALSDIGANVVNETSITPYLDGNFHRIEVFCNRTAGIQYLWIDGVLINTTTFTPNSTNFTNTARFAIGSYNNAAGTGLQADTEFDGIIRNVYFDKVI